VKEITKYCKYKNCHKCSCSLPQYEGRKLPNVIHISEYAERYLI